jgi:hypothetical protein
MTLAPATAWITVTSPIPIATCQSAHSSAANVKSARTVNPTNMAAVITARYNTVNSACDAIQNVSASIAKRRSARTANPTDTETVITARCTNVNSVCDAATSVIAVPILHAAPLPLPLHAAPALALPRHALMRAARLAAPPPPPPPRPLAIVTTRSITTAIAPHPPAPAHPRPLNARAVAMDTSTTVVIMDVVSVTIVSTKVVHSVETMVPLRCLVKIPEDSHGSYS